MADDQSASSGGGNNDELAELFKRLLRAAQERHAARGRGQTTSTPDNDTPGTDGHDGDTADVAPTTERHDTPHTNTDASDAGPNVRRSTAKAKKNRDDSPTAGDAPSQPSKEQKKPDNSVASASAGPASVPKTSEDRLDPDDLNDLSSGDDRNGGGDEDGGGPRAKESGAEVLGDSVFGDDDDDAELNVLGFKKDDQKTDADGEDSDEHGTGKGGHAGLTERYEPGQRRDLNSDDEEDEESKDGDSEDEEDDSSDSTPGDNKTTSKSSVSAKRRRRIAAIVLAPFILLIVIIVIIVGSLTIISTSTQQVMGSSEAAAMAYANADQQQTDIDAALIASMNSCLASDGSGKRVSVPTKNKDDSGDGTYDGKLYPKEPDSGSSGVGNLTPRQLQNAKLLIQEVNAEKLPEKAGIIILITGYAESHYWNLANDGSSSELKQDQSPEELRKSMKNPNSDGLPSAHGFGHGGDHGSVNILQQQFPWWGSIDELMDVRFAAKKFLEALKKIDGWETLDESTAAQRVQRSAVSSGDNYRQYIAQAKQIRAKVGDIGDSDAPDSGELTPNTSLVSNTDSSNSCIGSSDDDSDASTDSSTDSGDKAAPQSKDKNDDAPTGGDAGTKAVAVARKQIGIDYAWGGGDKSGPTKGIRDGGEGDAHGDYNKIGYDCSGLVEYVYGKAGISLPGDTTSQVRALSSAKVPTDEKTMKEGDLIYYPGHVAIYSGNGKMIEAPQSGEKVKETTVRLGGSSGVYRPTDLKGKNA